MKPSLIKLDNTGKFQRLLAGKPDTCGMKSGYVRLLPGESVGEHRTSGKEEAIIILEGKASVYIKGQKTFEAGSQEMVYIPPETDHDIRNNTQEILRYIYVVALV